MIPCPLKAIAVLEVVYLNLTISRIAGASSLAPQIALIPAVSEAVPPTARPDANGTRTATAIVRGRDFHLFPVIVAHDSRAVLL